MKSIIQTEKECFICRTPYGLESHHIFPGSNRPNSEKYGLKVWLCHRHHTGADSVHKQPGIMKRLQKVGQEAFEKINTREEFINIFKRSYL